MERFTPRDLISRRDISLKALLESARQDKMGCLRKIGAINELAESIETVSFWENLYAHLQGDKVSRQSLAGVFSSAKTSPQRNVYESLDGFLKNFGLRAVEFLFRDFQPQNSNEELLSIMQQTRSFAMEKYPRLRRLQWNDYKDTMESAYFWAGMNADLRKLSEPVTINRFFKQKKQRKCKTKGSLDNLEKNMRSRFSSGLTAKAQFIDYPNLSQIVEDTFKIDIRSFLLQYQNGPRPVHLQELIKETKQLIAQKILPLQPAREKMPHASFQELEEIVKSRTFWEALLQDIEKHMLSEHPVYRFEYFLRHYDRTLNEAPRNRIGTYTTLHTAFSNETKGITMEIVRSSGSKLVNYLMWGFRPDPELQNIVLETKRRVAEFFPYDCLYVELQDQLFWQNFERSILKTEKSMSFLIFLRYHSDDNINADKKFNKPNSALYRQFLHQSYHKPEDLKSLCAYLKLSVSDDYKANLRTLFLNLAPDSVRETLKVKFPSDFNNKNKEGEVIEKDS